MRTLGYPRVVSVCTGYPTHVCRMGRRLTHAPFLQMDNFRAPNFPLVADILCWLVARYDPSAKISDEIDTEGQRVAFLTAVAGIMSSRAQVQLKTKSLYAADGRAVRELLKVARVLYWCVLRVNVHLLVAARPPYPCRPLPRSAVRTCQDSLGRADDSPVTDSLHFSVKPSEMAATRQSASELTERGARLHELLRREGEVSPLRNRALSFLATVSQEDGRSEQEALERAIRTSIASVQDALHTLSTQGGELGEDERALEAKIGKKRTELERNQKRLESLQSVRCVAVLGSTLLCKVT